MEIVFWLLGITAGCYLYRFLDECCFKGTPGVIERPKYKATTKPPQRKNICAHCKNELKKEAQL